MIPRQIDEATDAVVGVVGVLVLTGIGLVVLVLMMTM